MNLEKCLKSFLNTISQLRYRRLGELNGVEYCPCGYKKGHTPPTDGWMPYTSDMPFLGTDDHAWFRAFFRTPSVAEGRELMLRLSTGFVGWWVIIHPQGLLYLNGVMVQGLDSNHFDAPLEPDTEYELYNYFYTGTNKGATFYRMRLIELDKRTEALYYDIKIPYETCMTMKSDDENRIRMLSVLVDATRMVDMRDPNSEEYRCSVEAAIDFLANEFYGKLCSTEGKPVVHCIGHTHIDVEWLWYREQTREKIQRSFATVKSLMDRYPEYKFMLSQPELYRYLKEDAPEKYEELKALVADGRWEPEGAMYLEPDCNLTSGESLVRQLMMGKQFFREEFGKESRVLIYRMCSDTVRLFLKF